MAGESAVDYVAAQLRQGIFHGRYAPGQRLVEADMTTEFSVSRHTVRAALGKLEADGLVEMTPNRGSIVRRLTRKTIADLFDLRGTLDAYGARLAAQNIGQGDNRVRLRRAIKVWERRDVLSDSAIHIEENAKYHELLFEIAGNERLIEVVRQLQIPGYRIRFRLLLDAERLARSAADHIAIGNAILDADARKAEAQARAHTQWSGALLQSLPDADFSH
jgi:DNA-binding GntR family transcriptional regulator